MILTEIQKNILKNRNIRNLEPLYEVCENDEFFKNVINEIQSLDWTPREKKQALRTICYVARQGKYWSKEEIKITILMSNYEALVTLTQIFDEKGAPYELWEDLFQKHLSVYERFVKESAIDNFESSEEYKKLCDEVYKRQIEFLDKGIISPDY